MGLGSIFTRLEKSCNVVIPNGMKSQAVEMDSLIIAGFVDQDRTKPPKSELKDELVADQGDDGQG